MQSGVPALLIFSLLTMPVAAQESLDELMQGFDEQKSSSSESMDGLMEGFEDSTPIVTEEDQPETLPWLSIGGYTSLSQSINYRHKEPQPGEADFRGLSRLRYKLSPEARVDLPKRWRVFASASGFLDGAFYANGRDQYKETYLDEYEKELELREFWISGSISKSFDIKLGRQIVVWGKSDSIRVVDVLNPLDLREPGMADIEDLRLPVTMARLDHYFGDWSFTAIVIPESRSNKMPVEGSDYYPMPFPLPEDNAPLHFKNPEYAFAMSGVFSGWDLSFHFASVHDDQFHIAQTDDGPKREYAHINMLGVSENMVFGSWLLKMEYAITDGLKFSTTGDEGFTRSDFIAGVDYSGINDHTISVEGKWSRIFSYDEQLEQEVIPVNEDSGQLAVRYTGNFLRETLQLVAWASISGLTGSEGGFYRASLKYIPQDAFSITGGVMVYKGGNSPFLNAIANNDRLFAEVRYDF